MKHTSTQEARCVGSGKEEEEEEEDAVFCAVLGKHPTGADIAKARTRAQLAEVARRLAAWQRELEQREHALCAHQQVQTQAPLSPPEPQGQAQQTAGRTEGRSKESKEGGSADGACCGGLGGEESDEELDKDFEIVGVCPAAAAASSSGGARKGRRGDTHGASELGGGDCGDVPAGVDGDGGDQSVCSSEDMAAAVRDALTWKGAQHQRSSSTATATATTTSGRNKKGRGLVCSEDGCMRLVVRADEALHRCGVCGRVFCADHSARLSVVFRQRALPVFVKKQQQQQQQQQRGVEAGETVAVVLCDECLEREQFQPGRTRDRSAQLIAERAAAANQHRARLARWKQGVASVVMAHIVALPPPSPAVPRSATTTTTTATSGRQQQEEGGGGVVLVWNSNSSNNSSKSSELDRWTWCSACGALFERLSKKHQCELCGRVVCSACGVVDCAMNTAMLLHVVGLDRVRRRLVAAPPPCSAAPAAAAAAAGHSVVVKACKQCQQLWQQCVVDVTFAVSTQAPDWQARCDEFVRIAQCCVDTLAFVEAQPARASTEEARREEEQATVQACNSVSAMLDEVGEGCVWLGRVAGSDGEEWSRAERAVVANIRRRLVDTSRACKAKLVGLRARLVAQQQHQQRQPR